MKAKQKKLSGCASNLLAHEDLGHLRKPIGEIYKPTSKPIEFSFDAPTWSLGKSMAAHITMGHIGEVYHKDLKGTVGVKTGGSRVVGPELCV